MELPKGRKASRSQQVRFSSSSRLIRIALENRRVVNSKAHFVPFKTAMSIFFRFEYSFHFELNKVYLGREGTIVKKNDMRMNGARIGFQSHYANLSGLLKNRSLLENNIKSKPKMTKTFFETKILFKEMPNLLLEAKNVRISCVYETRAI